MKETVVNINTDCINTTLNQINQTANKIFGGYIETHYVHGDSDEVVSQKKVANAQKVDWINRKTKELVSNAMMGLVNIANGSGNDVLVDALFEGIHRTHREIQRMFIQEHLLPFLLKYAETADDVMYSDGRNEGIKKQLLEMITPFKYLCR